MTGTKTGVESLLDSIAIVMFNGRLIVIYIYTLA